MDVPIYHNPACGTSRNPLALIRHAGIEPTVIDYVKAPPTRDQLVKMIGDAGLTVRQAIREKGTPYAELGLDDPNRSDDELVDAMLTHPILINRPFVVTPMGTPSRVPPNACWISCRRSTRARSPRKMAKRLIQGIFGCFLLLTGSRSRSRGRR